jgi:hypothetical protein
MCSLVCTSEDEGFAASTNPPADNLIRHRIYAKNKPIIIAFLEIADASISHHASFRHTRARLTADRSRSAK